MVVTSLTRNQVVRKGTWVRIPPPPSKTPICLTDRGFIISAEYYMQSTVEECLQFERLNALFLPFVQDEAH